MLTNKFAHVNTYKQICKTSKGSCAFFSSLDYLQLLVDEKAGHAHTSANAHGGEQDLGLAASALAQTCDDLPCACAAKRVALEDLLAIVSE